MANTDEKTIQEIEHLYPDEWVLVEETAWDDTDLPIRGRVVVHSRERHTLTLHI